MVTLLVALLVGVPLLAFATARGAYESGVRAERTAGGSRVPARLTADAPVPAPAPVSGEHAPPPRTLAPARWTHAGTVHTGQVRALAGSPAGTAVVVHVDGEGRLTDPPRTRAQTVGWTAVTGAGAVAGPAFGLWLVRRAVNRAFIRRQLPAWGAEWAAAEPEWTGRR